LRYVCAVAFVDPSDGEERVFFGECRGRLAGERRGARGFGYDPAFLPDEDPGLRSDGGAAAGAGAGAGAGRTMAELSEADKDAISHRGHALRAFAEWYLS
jgi:XTP/dITP diphosphohydrolase